jgi:hypothetical protein
VESIAAATQLRESERLPPVTTVHMAIKQGHSQAITVYTSNDTSSHASGLCGTVTVTAVQSGDHQHSPSTGQLFPGSQGHRLPSSQPLANRDLFPVSITGSFSKHHVNKLIHIHPLEIFFFCPLKTSPLGFVKVLTRWYLLTLYHQVIFYGIDGAQLVQLCTCWRSMPWFSLFSVTDRATVNTHEQVPLWT